MAIELALNHMHVNREEGIPVGASLHPSTLFQDSAYAFKDGEPCEIALDPKNQQLVIRAIGEKQAID
jgi:hypothetical protein